MGAMASQITSLAIVNSIVYSGVDQRKHQSSASLAFVRGIHRGLLNCPHKWPVTRKMFPLDDVIMWHSVNMSAALSFVALRRRSPQQQRNQLVADFPATLISKIAGLITGTRQVICVKISIWSYIHGWFVMVMLVSCLVPVHFQLS